MGNGQGKGKTADAAVNDAAKNLSPGKYDATVVGTVEKKNTPPQPSPIGDYRATLKPTS